jgi:hypothetical protein
MTPSRFKEELKRFDKRLDLKFNGAKGRWEIWGTDRKNIQYLIKSFYLGEIEKMGLNVIREMAEVSPMKSSAKEVNARIDRIIEEEEKQEAKATKDAINDRLDESWERYQYAEGSRISFARTESKLNDSKEFVITDKRRFKDSSIVDNGGTNVN